MMEMTKWKTVTGAGNDSREWPDGVSNMLIEPREVKGWRLKLSGSIALASPYMGFHYRFSCEGAVDPRRILGEECDSR